jgi:hypothetical protein
MPENFESGGQGFESLPARHYSTSQDNFGSASFLMGWPKAIVLRQRPGCNLSLDWQASSSTLRGMRFYFESLHAEIVFLSDVGEEHAPPFWK